MLTEDQILDIRGHLEKAQNPVFFFDNDTDGLCSFLVLQRYCGKGKGVAIKSFPELSGDYMRKINELNADYIFILDKPIVSKEFLDEIEKVNIPIVWIDHHETDKKEIPSFVNYFNPVFNDLKGNEPTTFLCYQISQKEEDMWIGVVGCIADKYVPNFYGKFKENYPDLSYDSDDAFDIFYKSQIGKIARMFSFGLKDRTTNVVNMMKFLMKVKSPYEVLEESSQNRTMHRRFDLINSKHHKFVEKASANAGKSKLLFFKYGGDMSISSDISNELSYRFPDKIVIVAYISGAKVNISGRGKHVKEKVLKAIENLENARGGGHEDAVGAQIRESDIDEFRKNLETLV